MSIAAGRVAYLLRAIVLAVGAAATNAAAVCGNPFDTAGVGPFDYHDESQKNMLGTVEGAHFFPRIKREALSGGEVDPNLAGDLDYTLRAFPNHSEALYAMAMHQLHVRRSAPAKYRDSFGPGRLYHSAECYFERALMLRPDDAAVFTSYGLYLYRKRDRQGALEKFSLAAKHNPESPKVHYNLGLLNFEMKRYAQAREHAKEAYRLGYKKPQLKRMLMRVKQWH